MSYKNVGFIQLALQINIYPYVTASYAVSQNARRVTLVNELLYFRSYGNCLKLVFLVSLIVTNLGTP